MSNERDFKGIWIPVELWQDENLTSFEIIVLAEIDSLDKGEGCWMTGKALAKRMRCSLSHIQNLMTSLRKRKYLFTVHRTREKRFLRTRFSRHLNGIKSTIKVNGQTTADGSFKTTADGSFKTTADGSSVLTSLVLRKQRREHSAAGAARTAGAVQCDFGVNGESIEKKITTKFHEFTIKNRMLTGRLKPKLRTWEQSVHLLLQQLKSRSRVTKVLRWYFDHFQDQYVPKCYALTTFCDKFLAVESAMQRAQEREPESTAPSIERVIVSRKADWNF